MKQKFLALLLLSIFIFILAGEKASSNLKESEWQYIKSTHDVKSFLRQKTLDNNTKVKEIKAEACIQVPKDKLLNIIQSGIYTSEWMSGVDNYYIKNKISRDQWESELSLKTLWPLSNVNLCMNYNVLSNYNSSVIYFKSKEASFAKFDIHPETYQFNGSWKLIFLNKYSTKVVLTTEWNENNVLRYWCITPIISESLTDSLKKLKRLTEEKCNTKKIAQETYY